MGAVFIFHCARFFDRDPWHVKNNEVSFLVNTVEEKRTAIADSRSIRTSALANRVTFYTTIEGARAACAGMRHLKDIETYALQSLHSQLA